jgi:galactokinase/mevalonate kinase-like predicted kinase
MKSIAINREPFEIVGLGRRAIEVALMADIPAGTGLKSSGSFTTALLKALQTTESSSSIRASSPSRPAISRAAIDAKGRQAGSRAQPAQANDMDEQTPCAPM